MTPAAANDAGGRFRVELEDRAVPDESSCVTGAVIPVDGGSAFTINQPS